MKRVPRNNYELFFAPEITSVATYYESITPSWKIETSVVGLMVVMVGLALFCIVKLCEIVTKNLPVEKVAN